MVRFPSRDSIPALSMQDNQFVFAMIAIARCWNSGEGDTEVLLYLVELFEEEANNRGLNVDAIYSRIN